MCGTRNPIEVPALKAKDPRRAVLERRRRAIPVNQTENAKAGDVLQELMNRAKRDSGQVLPEKKNDHSDQKPEQFNKWPEGLVESKAYWDFATRLAMAAKFVSKEITAKRRDEVKSRPPPRGHGRKGLMTEGTIAPPPGGSTHGESVKVAKKRQRAALARGSNESSTKAEEAAMQQTWTETRARG